MDALASLEPLQALIFALGVFALGLGLSVLTWRRRGRATAPAWVASARKLASDPAPAAMAEYRRLADLDAGSVIPRPPGLRPAPLTIDGGGAAHPKSGAAVLLNTGPGPALPGEGAAFPPPSLPATPSYQAVMLGGAGKWGNYWQEIGRCGHRHPTIDAAYDCLRSLRLELGQPEIAPEQISGVGWAVE